MYRCGLLTAILLNSGAADFVITGCGTGEGAMLSMQLSSQAFFVDMLLIRLGRLHVLPRSMLEMLLHSHLQRALAGALSLHLQYCIRETVLLREPGGGYPPERVVPEQRNKKILDECKEDHSY